MTEMNDWQEENFFWRRGRPGILNRQIKRGWHKQNNRGLAESVFVCEL